MGPAMHTLFDFLTHTKSIGYIVAALCLGGFALFWRFLTERERPTGGPDVTGAH